MVLKLILFFLIGYNAYMIHSLKVYQNAAKLFDKSINESPHIDLTFNENGEVVLSEITGPGASQRPRGNRRPVAIRRRPIGRRRRPINEDQEEIIEEPFEEKKAFLVCSGGKCFRYVITIFVFPFK